VTGSRRPSAQTTAVVLALAEQPASWRYGYELCRQLGLKAGSVYPILMRLADRGLLETSWESGAPAGRPPRHLYRLTGPGRALAAELASAPSPLKPARTAGRVRRRPRLEGT
jgi:DNA-binding PadR family transcriptional regulator